jgi:hypothetical protein
MNTGNLEYGPREGCRLEFEVQDLEPEDMEVPELEEDEEEESAYEAAMKMGEEEEE